MKPIIIAALALGLLAAPDSASALDRIYIATESYNGDLLIRVYAGDGQRVGDIPIRQNYVQAKFLVGKWLPGEGLSVVALLQDGANSFAHVLDQNGTAVAEYGLGMNVLQVLAVDHDRSGLSDLVVQRKKGALQIYLDPGIRSGRSNTLKMPKSSDAIPVLRRDGEAIGFMTLSTDNRNTRSLRAARPARGKAKRGKAKNKKKKGFIQYVNETGRSVRLQVAVDVQDILPVRLPSATAFIVQTEKQLTLIGEGLAPKVFRKRLTDALLTGSFKQPFSSTLAFGAPLDVSTETAFAPITYVDPVSEESSGVQLNMSDTVRAQPVPDPAIPPECAQYDDLLQQFLAAYNAGDFAEAMRIAAILESIDTSACSSSSPPDPDEDSVFNPRSVNYLTGVVKYGSNTGLAKGPCSELLDGFDGFGGFVAKNSDSYPGVVYLTPGYDFQNGRVLNPKTFKVRYKTTYGGVANGGRAHFRIINSSVALPMGAHIFAADTYGGKTICWKIPDGLSRID